MHFLGSVIDRYQLFTFETKCLNGSGKFKYSETACHKLYTSQTTFLNKKLSQVLNSILSNECTSCNKIGQKSGSIKQSRVVLRDKKGRDKENKFQKDGYLLFYGRDCPTKQ